MKPQLWHSEHNAQDHTNKYINKDEILSKPTEPDGLTDSHAVSLRLQANDYSNPCKYINILKPGPPVWGGAVPSFSLVLPHPWLAEWSVGL